VKENARTHWLHQKPKPENHGHGRKIIGVNKRNEEYIQQNKNRKLPNSRENYAHSGIGSLPNTEQM
jgi:hypothetical protein